MIKSNVEYDRLTLNTYDYLNFFSFYLGFALKKRVDMPGVELLDEVRVPLLADAYSDEERQVSFQLYQRAARLGSLGSTFRKGFLTRNPRELLDEWTAGLDTGELMLQQMERELFRKLKDPSVRYLDYYTTSFDHVAHLNRDLKTQAIHRTRYTNALISLHEHFHSHAEEILRPEEPGLSGEERLLRRFRLRQRRMVEPDLLVLARNYWNFNVRGFNPGGNHGSFFPLSTRATLMFSGGNETGIPRGLLIDQPYDTLSFVPTLLALTGQLRGQNPRPSLSKRGFRRFPGPVIEELFP